MTAYERNQLAAANQRAGLPSLKEAVRQRENAEREERHSIAEGQYEKILISQALRSIK